MNLVLKVEFWMASLLLAGPVIAQVIPDAGSLQRETQRNLEQPQPAWTAPSKDQNNNAEDASDLKIEVKSFEVQGAQKVAQEDLQQFLDPYVGQILTWKQLQHVVMEIQRFYQSQGWYARVFLPEQDVSGGNIRVQVVEGRWGGSRLIPQEEGGRVDAREVERMATHRLEAGHTMSARNLERGLLLANDLPGILAIGVLSPGDGEGVVNLNLKVQDTPWITGDVSVSNHGLRPTGKAQFSGGISVNNLSGHGDQLSLRMLGSAHLGSVQARYSAPLGYDGWRWAGWASMLRYSLAGPYSALDAKGDAWNYGIGLNYPLIRQAQRNLRIDMTLQQNQYKDDMLEEVVRRSHVNALVIGINGDWTDRFAGGAVNWGGVDLSVGKTHLREVGGAAALDRVGPDTQGYYSKISGNFSRLQNIQGNWQALVGVNGQWSNHNLASSERMSLGGPAQVRAYPVNEASGDAGLVLKMQLQNTFSPGWQAQLFYDWGWIRQHHRLWANWDGGTGQPNSYHLAGWGVGVTWNGQGAYAGWRVQASVATPTGSNKGHTNHRNSDDSSLHSTRGWLTVSYQF